MLSLLIGAVVATGVSMAGLRLITSFVPGPEARRDPVTPPSGESSAPTRPATR